VNARDAMPQGGSLVIRTADTVFNEPYVLRHAHVPPGRYVLLEVTDTGCGMDENTLTQIFDPFFTTKGQGKGTGLGLSTVYGIIQQCNGHIHVASKPGQGTTFQIYLPITEEKAPRERPDLQEDMWSAQGETVLLVEDDESLRRPMEIALERLGFHVTVVGDADEALLVVQKGLKPHLLVTDVVLPGMSGPFLAQRLCEDLPHLRVLYVSGYADRSLFPNGTAHDRLVFLQKPFSLRDLAMKCREALSNSAR